MAFEIEVPGLEKDVDGLMTLLLAAAGEKDCALIPWVVGPMNELGVPFELVRKALGTTEEELRSHTNLLGALGLGGTFTGCQRRRLTLAYGRSETVEALGIGAVAMVVHRVTTQRKAEGSEWARLFCLYGQAEQVLQTILQPAATVTEQLTA